MRNRIKYLRILVAIILPVCVIYNYVTSIIQQSQALLDGPLAHYMSHTFALNKVVLAICLSLVLLCDFKLRLPSWGNSVLRVIGIVSVVLSLIGFIYLIWQQAFLGYMRFLVELYVFQTAYLLVSFLILAKSFEGKSDA